MGRDEFLKRLAVEFPNVVAAINRYEAGLLHCEVAAFRRVTEEAMDAGRLWEAERYFRLVEELLPMADPDLANALEVSYLEDLALGKWTPARYRAVRERMSPKMRGVLAGHYSGWR